jgi:hypothetical protein
MKKILSAAIVFCATLSSQAFWVPSPPSKDSPDTLSYNEFGVWSPPGVSGGDSLYTWVDLPDIAMTLLPPIAREAASAPAPSLLTNQTNETEKRTVEEGQTAQRDATIPRFNDVTADVECGIISFKPTGSQNAYHGFGLSAKGRYERESDDDDVYGVKIDNEYTGYADYMTLKIPGTDFLLLGGYYRKPVSNSIDLGAQINVSSLFRTITAYNPVTKISSKKRLYDFAVNPQLYGIYNFEMAPLYSKGGPILGYAGIFCGYTYSSFSFRKNQLPYAAIAGIGSTFGRRVAAQADLALSHQFLIIGAQAPIYFSKRFSITTGLKYPLLFQATQYVNVRLTIGASTRF